MTTNHYDDLDPALVRAGRIQITIHLEFCTKNQIADMYNFFYDYPLDPKIVDQLPEKEVTPAFVQNLMFVLHPDEFDDEGKMTKKCSGEAVKVLLDIAEKAEKAKTAKKAKKLEESNVTDHFVNMFNSMKPDKKIFTIVAMEILSSIGMGEDCN